MIETIVPIPLDQLKLYFQDKNTKFLLDYANSSLKGDKFLTYISNLDVPADVKVDITTDEGRELLRSYFHAPNLVRLEALEILALQTLFQARDLNNFGLEQFIDDNKGIIDQWLSVIDSLTLYNMYTLGVPQFKEWVQQFPADESIEAGVNFVNLIQHQEMYALLEKSEVANLKFYTSYFDKYMFKGRNLFSFWANPNNPMFLLTTGIATGQIKPAEAAQGEPA